MNVLTISIPPRLGALTLVGNLQPIAYRPALQPVLFSQRVGGITIPVFPLDGDTSRLIDGNGAFLVDGNGDTLAW